MFDDEEPKDWEMKDEEPPERLQKKWERDETAASKTVVCSSCKKETPARSLNCIFCGADLSRGSFLESRFLSWLKRLFKNS